MCVCLCSWFARGGVVVGNARSFDRVDVEFRSIMGDVGEDPYVYRLSQVPNFKDSLVEMIDQLERCQKALNDFMEAKRSVFPRFYFIGDDDLLEIIGQSQNPEVIQTHLKKLFQG